MNVDESLLRVPLGDFAMQLRPGELEKVAAGLGEFDSSEEGDLITLASALRRLPAGDRAPTWELAVRRYGRHRSVAGAAGDIGLDEIHARDLLGRFTRLLTEVPAPEHEAALADPSAQLEESSAARVVSAEMLGNAIAHDEPVDLDREHQVALRAADEIDAA